MDFLSYFGLASPGGIAARTPPAPIPGTPPVNVAEGALTLASAENPGAVCRLCYILGPNSTLRSVADALGAALFSAQHPVLAGDDLCRALLAYNAAYLALPAVGAIQVGLRVVCPVEISTPGEWTIDTARWRQLAQACTPGLLATLDVPASPLLLPTADSLASDYTTYSRQHTDDTGLASDLVTRLLRNPYEACLLAWRALADTSRASGIAFRFSDALVAAGGIEGIAATLAATTGGNAILRQLYLVLAGSAAAGAVDAASQAAGLTLATTALGLPDGTDPRTMVPSVRPVEPPTTSADLADRGGHDSNHAGLVEVAGGVHRLVLGRDVVSSFATHYPKTNPTFLGPAYSGRLDVAAAITARTNTYNPHNTAARTARLNVIGVVALNEARLDGARIADAGVLSVGFQQWTTHYEPWPLGNWATAVPNEWDLFLGMYGLGITGSTNDRGSWRLRGLVGPAGTTTTFVMVSGFGPHSQGKFFGGVKSGAVVSYIPGAWEWAARFRLAGLISRAWQDTQIFAAVARFDIIRAYVSKTWSIGGVKYGLADIITSEFGAALVLDQHVNSPGNIADDIGSAIGKVKPATLTDQARVDIANSYADIRRFNNDSDKKVHDARTKTIRDARDGNRLDARPGSFRAWTE